MGSTTMTSTMEISSGRRQPVRSTRVNPARNASAVREEIEEEIPPMFLPGITHFTNHISAIPKEMIRQSGMLKEVEAKLHAPEQQFKAFLASKPPPFAPDQEDPRDCPAQRYYDDACNMMASMLGSLDEKNHVLSTANESIEKLLARAESAWPLIEQEISEETRWGRLDNWAYTDRIVDKKPAANAERASRRNNDAEKAAAALVADITSSKGAKGHRRIGQDAADMDDVVRKGSQNKRKPNDNAGSAGLGITSTAVKRRKVEKPLPSATNGGYAMQKSLSSVFANTPGSPTVSATDGRRKGKNPNGTTSNGRKRAGTTNSNADSPMMAASPVIGNWALPGKGVNSPALGAPMARTTSSRARGGPTSNPAQSNRPASAASTPLMNGLSYPDEKPTISRTNSGFRGEEAGNIDDARGHSKVGMKREDPNSKPRPPSIPTTSRNNGKASKTGTPVLGTFPDASRPRSGRNSTTALNAMDMIPPKRSHKKKEPAALQRQRSQQKAEHAQDEEDSERGAEEDQPEESEQTYCYCNGPSHGDMIACDMPGCEKEWFHLNCVGLTKPPNTKTKWYCPDCAPKLANKRGAERVAAVV